MKKIIKIVQAIQLKPLGMGFCVAGLSLGMFLDFVLKGSVKWTTLFMALTVLLIADWRNLLRLRFPSFNVMLRWVFLFQLMMLCYGFVSTNLTSQLLFFHLYIIALSLSFASIKTNKDLGNVSNYVFWMMIPSTLFATFFCATGLVTGESAYFYKQEVGEDNYNLDTLSVSVPAVYMLFAIYCTKAKPMAFFLLKIVLGLMAGYVLLECGKRTAPFMALLGVVIVLYVKIKLTFKLIPSAVRIVIFTVIVGVLAYTTVDFIQEKVDAFVDTFYNGVLGLLGSKTADYTDSVDERLQIRKMALDYIDQNFTIFNYIFGGGYFVRWLDSPLFQSWVDMGIAGFVLFFTIIVGFPFYIMRKRIDDSNVLIALLLCLYPMFTIISSGHPYQPIKYTPICMLSFMYYRYKHQKKNDRKGSLRHI